MGNICLKGKRVSEDTGGPPVRRAFPNCVARREPRQPQLQLARCNRVHCTLNNIQALQEALLPSPTLWKQHNPKEVATRPRDTLQASPLREAQRCPSPNNVFANLAF